MATENIHIISEHHCASVLRDMYQRQGSLHDKVVLFTDTLCHGRLSLDRRHYWRDLMRSKPEYPFTPYEISLTVNNMQRPLDMLPQWLAHECQIWIWCSDSLQDELMLNQLLCAQEPQHAKQFNIVRYASRRRAANTDSLTYTEQYPMGMHLAECIKYAEPVTPADIEAAAALWKHLLLEDEPLRYRRDGKIFSTSASFYDAVLLNAADEGWNKALMLVARSSACLTDSPGYEFLLRRLSHLIDEGLLEARHTEQYWAGVEICLPQKQPAEWA